MHELTTPLGDEIYSLHAGDTVYLSGMIYTARDEAHLRMQEEGIPFEPQGAVIYHCGPVIQDQKIIAAGPTTSARMNPLTAPVLDAGVRGLIGKGGMSAAVTEQLRGRGVYFSFTGGCAVLAATHMQLKGVHYPDLGMAEAIWELELKKLPLIVGIDAHGTSLFANIDEHAKMAFKKLYP
ncbi:MAG: FumA C-terminus/TtdB family hydratase beta subunit [Methanomicrobiales archaeon]|jgi:fumarate hydratase subunit beta|nr:FumA C-terminus/TtdB family hydratase beta subunit [Methanomicrobiales archaeon]